MTLCTRTSPAVFIITEQDLQDIAEHRLGRPLTEEELDNAAHVFEKAMQ